ncbi:MAG: hypothetical protein ABIP51_14990 [Bacteroidia bacterium]
MNKTTQHSCTACSMLARGVKFRRDPRHTCNTEPQFYKGISEYFVKDGIVYLKDKDSGHYTAYLLSRPGIICQAEKVEDVPFLIKEILDSIEGWND